MAGSDAKPKTQFDKCGEILSRSTVFNFFCLFFGHVMFFLLLISEVEIVGLHNITGGLTARVLLAVYTCKCDPKLTFKSVVFCIVIVCWPLHLNAS